MLRHLLALIASLGALLALCSGCSLAFDPPQGQCATDVDCAALSVDGRCDLAAHVCVTTGQLSSSSLPPPTPVTCGSPSAVSAYPFIEGSGSIPPSPDCGCVEGAYDDPSALVIGVIAPE